LCDDPGVGDDGPPAALLRDAGLSVLSGEIRPREGRAWLVEWRGTRGVLRRLLQRSRPEPGLAAFVPVDDVSWLHAFLERLAGLSFPSPRPLPCFGGRSWTEAHDALWTAVSYLPGQAVGWAAAPTMEEIGALLGRYHTAVRQIPVVGQRPSALPLGDVPEVLLSGRRLEAAGVRPDRAAIIRRLAGELARDLARAGRLTTEQVIIHGDFTSHNVIAEGVPPRAAGVIDFDLAHADTPLADIGYGLWRSGRPFQEADRVDLTRITRFLRGYAAAAQVSPDEARVIPVYLRGRGLQMIAKRVLMGRAETGMLAQVLWLSAHTGAVGDALAAAVS
jgi:Ser/Thr protein kinase RdoA (MazF antagonist)